MNKLLFINAQQRFNVTNKISISSIFVFVSITISHTGHKPIFNKRFHYYSKFFQTYRLLYEAACTEFVTVIYIYI